MHRFFVSPEVVARQDVSLGPELAHRLGRVLRLQPGDHVLLLDGSGREYEVELTALSASAVRGSVVASHEGRGEPRLRLTLYQALIKAPRFDWILEKGTELGVWSFVPVVSSRSVVRPSKTSAGRLERWRRIVTEAAEQSGRSRLPQVSLPVSFADAVASAPGLRLLPWEDEADATLREALAAEGPPETVSLFIGPEGGFPTEEVEMARRQGVRTVSLGPRILRAETAAIVAAALILHELGEMSP